MNCYMNKSIINNKKECIVCHTTNNLNCHHIIFGKNRNNADKDGLTVYLCYEHHEGTNGVHGKNGHKLDLKLKQLAEKKWCEYYNKTSNEFLERYHKNYL